MKNNTARTVVALIRKASNPRDFVFTLPSSAVPVNVDAALLLDGCMTTKIIIKMDTMINAVSKMLYT